MKVAIVVWRAWFRFEREKGLSVVVFANEVHQQHFSLISNKGR
jgi:hypothetical protein